MMTETQAWREIAKRVAQRTHDIAVFPIGLCIEVEDMLDVISDDTFDRMMGRLAFHLNGELWAYSPYESNNGPRVLAALWLALEAMAE